MATLRDAVLDSKGADDSQEISQGKEGRSVAPSSNVETFRLTPNYLLLTYGLFYNLV